MEDWEKQHIDALREAKAVVEVQKVIVLCGHTFTNDIQLVKINGNIGIEMEENNGYHEVLDLSDGELITKMCDGDFERIDEEDGGYLCFNDLVKELENE